MDCTDEKLAKFTWRNCNNISMETKVTVSSTMSLLPGLWVNDEVITYICVGMNKNTMFNKMQEQSNNRHRNCIVVPPYLITRLMSPMTNNEQYDFQGPKRFGTKIFDGRSAMDFDMIVFILNQENIHWKIVTVYPKNFIIDVWDSNGNDCRGLNKEEKEVTYRLYRWLYDDVFFNHGAEQVQKFTSQQWKILCGRKVPQQQNGDDCGVFSLVFAFCLVRNFNVHLIKPEYMSEVRMYFLQEIFQSGCVLHYEKKSTLELITQQKYKDLDDEIRNMVLEMKTYKEELGITSDTGYKFPSKYPPEVNSKDLLEVWCGNEDPKKDNETIPKITPPNTQDSETENNNTRKNVVTPTQSLASPERIPVKEKAKEDVADPLKETNKQNEKICNYGHQCVAIGNDCLIFCYEGECPNWLHSKCTQVFQSSYENEETQEMLCLDCCQKKAISSGWKLKRSSPVSASSTRKQQKSVAKENITT